MHDKLITYIHVYIYTYIILGKTRSESALASAPARDVVNIPSLGGSLESGVKIDNVIIFI